MIFGGLKHSAIKKRIKKVLTANELSDQFCLNDSSSIVLIVNENTPENLSELLSVLLKVDKQNIKTIIFSEEKNSNEVIFTEKDFSKSGKIKNQYLKELLENEFDLLLNYNKENVFTDYLTVLFNAKFRVGLFSSKVQIFDLTIGVKADEIDLFNKELKKYLEILSKR